MQIPRLQVLGFDAVETGSCGKEVVRVADLQLETFAHAGLVEAAVDDHGKAGDGGPMSWLAARRRIAAEAQIVPKVAPIAVVLPLADGADLESPGDVVLGDPDLVVAVGQVGRVNQLHLVGHVLADRQPRGGIRFVGDEHGLDPHFADPGCLLDSAPELGADAAGEVREGLYLGHIGLLAAHLVNRAPGHDQRHDVRLGQRRIRRPGRLGLARRPGHGNPDVVVAGFRVEEQIEGWHDPAIVGEGDDATLHFVAARVQRELPSLGNRQASGQPGLVRRADETQIRIDPGGGQAVVDHHGCRGIHVDVEAHALEQTVSRFGEIPGRGAVMAANSPSSKSMSVVRPASLMVSWPATRNSSARLVTWIVASDRLRISSGAS